MQFSTFFQFVISEMFFVSEHTLLFIKCFASDSVLAFLHYLAQMSR